MIRLRLIFLHENDDTHCFDGSILTTIIIRKTARTDSESVEWSSRNNTEEKKNTKNSLFALCFCWCDFFAFIFLLSLCLRVTHKNYSACTAAECRLWVPPSFKHIIDSNVISSFSPLLSFGRSSLFSVCMGDSLSLSPSRSKYALTYSTRIFHILCKVRTCCLFLAVIRSCCAMHYHFSIVAFGENERSIGINTHEHGSSSSTARHGRLWIQEKESEREEANVYCIHICIGPHWMDGISRPSNQLNENHRTK